MRRWLIPVLVTISVAPRPAPIARGGGGAAQHRRQGGHCRGRARERGRSFKFLLDTGTARTVVADALARELGAPVVATSEVVTIAGSDRRLVVRLDSIAVSPVKVDGVLAPLVPAPELAALGHGVRGLLGQDFLSAFNYTLDYRHARLTWTKWERARAWRGADAAAEGRFSMVLTGRRRPRPCGVVPDSGAEVAVLFRARGPRAGEAGRHEALRSLQIGEVTLRNPRRLHRRARRSGRRWSPAAARILERVVCRGGACLIARK